MPTNNEQTFGDRLARGRTMSGKIAAFTPALAPSDTSLTSPNFKLFLDLVEAKNGLVAAAESGESDAITLRKLLYELIKTRTLRAVDFVSSNEVWASFLPKVKENAAMVRNSRPPKRPPAVPGVPAKAPRKTGQQSFGDIDRWFEKVIEAVKLVPGYSPDVTTNIQIAQLTTLLGDYRSANLAVAQKGAVASKERSERLPLYNGKTASLRSKMKAIKKATSGQYGRDSTHFAEVKSIAL